MKKIFLAILAITLSASPAFSQSDLDLLLKAKTIRCKIKEGSTTTFNGKETSFEKGLFSKTPEDNIVTYTNLNLKEGVALVVGNAGSDELAIRMGESGLNFIGFTGSGAMVTATVFSNRESSGGYFYVMSRHTQLSFGETTSMPSQWIGTCKVIE